MLERSIMLDPSLMLAQNAFKNTFDLASAFSEMSEEFRFYSPSSLTRLTGARLAAPDSPAIRFFLHNAKAIELDVLDTFIKQYSYAIRGYIPAEEQVSKYRSVYEVLLEELESRGELPDREDTALCDMLFEELIFLLEHSWTVSRIRKPFNRFIAAGTVCIQYGRRAVDALAKRTLKKEEHEAINTIDRLRAFGKWIAVGGTSALALVSPAVASIAISATLSLFLLVDPQASINDTLARSRAIPSILHFLAKS